MNGPNAHDLYQYLRINSSLNKEASNDIPWNFAKFLVDENGEVSGYYTPKTEPVAIKGDIEKLIGICWWEYKS